MTRDEFQQMLDQHGIVFVGEDAWRVAQLVAAAERDACAQVCDDLDLRNNELRPEYQKGAWNAARAIRARGEK